MSRAHFCKSRNFPVEPQKAACVAAGATILYEDDIDNAIRHLRKGEKLLAHTFRGLAPSRKAIEDAVDAIHAKGAYVVDATTGWRSDGPNGHKLTSQAVASLSRERQGGGKQPEKNGRLGGLAKGANRRARTMPERAMEKIWFNKALDRDEVMERINGAGYEEISYSALHKKFGKRGIKLGRSFKTN